MDPNANSDCGCSSWEQLFLDICVFQNHLVELLQKCTWHVGVTSARCGIRLSSVGSSQKHYFEQLSMHKNTFTRAKDSR